MTTILIACAALAATLLVAAVFSLGRRSGSAAETRLDAVAAQIDERMQTMVQDLSQVERMTSRTRSAASASTRSPTRWPIRGSRAALRARPGSRTGSPPRAGRSRTRPRSSAAASHPAGPSIPPKGSPAPRPAASRVRVTTSSMSIVPLSSPSTRHAGRLHLSAGVTELRPDDDVISFFERADEALYRAKGAGKGTVVAIETPTLLPREAPGTASSS